MLVLTRKPMDAIDIGGNIKVTVLSVAGNQVRIGIDAPKHIQIVRDDAIYRQPRDYVERNGNQ